MLALLAWGVGYFIATSRQAQELEEVGAAAGGVALIVLGVVTLVLVRGILIGGRPSRLVAIILYGFFGLAALRRLVHEATEGSAGPGSDFAPPIIVLAGCAAVVTLLLFSRREPTI
jgi:hypothetical protein